MKTLRLNLFLGVLLLVLFIPPVQAQETIPDPTPPPGVPDIPIPIDPQNPPGVEGFLSLVAAGLLSSTISILLEKAKWFQNLSGEARFRVTMLITGLVPALATALLTYVPAFVWEAMDPYWFAILAGLGGLTGITGGQAAHRALHKS